MSITENICAEQRRAVITAIESDAITAARIFLKLGDTDSAIRAIEDASERLERLGW